MAPRGRAEAAAAKAAAAKAAGAKGAAKAAAEAAIGDKAVAQPPVGVEAAVAAKAAVKAEAAIAATARARRAAQAAADKAGGGTGAGGGGPLALALAGALGGGGVIRAPCILGGAPVGLSGGGFGAALPGVRGGMPMQPSVPGGRLALPALGWPEPAPPPGKESLKLNPLEQYYEGWVDFVQEPGTYIELPTRTLIEAATTDQADTIDGTAPFVVRCKCGPDGHGVFLEAAYGGALSRMQAATLTPSFDVELPPRGSEFQEKGNSKGGRGIPGIPQINTFYGNSNL